MRAREQNDGFTQSDMRRDQYVKPQCLLITQTCKPFPFL